MAAGADDRHRIDRWLWFARLYRSRSLAARAVGGGRVHVNGARVKPSRELAIGDRLDLARGPEAITVIVRALPARRGPASETTGCWEETPESRTRREAERAARRFERSLAVAPPGRPDRRDRRAIRRLQGRD